MANPGCVEHNLAAGHKLILDPGKYEWLSTTWPCDHECVNHRFAEGNELNLDPSCVGGRGAGQIEARAQRGPDLRGIESHWSGRRGLGPLRPLSFSGILPHSWQNPEKLAV